MQVVDDLPDELQFVSLTAPQGVTCSVDVQTVTCVHDADLGVGETYSVQVTTGLPPVGVEAVNGAVVSRVAGVEITLVDNQDSDTVEVDPPTLAITGAGRVQTMVILGLGFILLGLMALVGLDIQRRRQRLQL